MARERCAGCSGSGKGIDWKGVCIYCGGSGTIWVPDKVKPGPVGGYVRRSSGSSASARSVEELLASLLAIAAFCYLVYYGFTKEWEWYWPFIIGLLVGVCTYYLFMGPLRFVLVLAKWVITFGLMVTVIWGIYQIWLAFTAG